MTFIPENKFMLWNCVHRPQRLNQPVTENVFFFSYHTTNGNQTKHCFVFVFRWHHFKKILIYYALAKILPQVSINWKWTYFLKKEALNFHCNWVFTMKEKWWVEAYRRKFVMWKITKSNTLIIVINIINLDRLILKGIYI